MIEAKASVYTRKVSLIPARLVGTPSCIAAVLLWFFFFFQYGRCEVMLQRSIQ